MASILYLNLTDSEGKTRITDNIPVNSILRLQKVCITWDDVPASISAGSLINLDIGLFNHKSINSNKTKMLTSIPLFNNVSQQVSLYTLDMGISSIHDITQKFKYKLTDINGDLITNFESVQVCFSYAAQR